MASRSGIVGGAGDKELKQTHILPRSVGPVENFPTSHCIFFGMHIIFIRRHSEEVEKHASVVGLLSSIATTLVHLSDELVDVGFPVTEIATLHVVLELPRPPSTSGVGELEWPQEVGCLTIKH